MGDEKLISSSLHRRYGSQPISVPFLWEEKPGMPKRDWIAESLPFVAAKFSEAKPLKLVISVPFRWEEEPGKPLLPMDENLRPSILPVPASSRNPSINEAESVVLDAFAFHGSSNEGDSNQNESWYSASEREARNDPSSSTMQIELEVKSCSRNRSHLVKRTLTLGELMLLSRKLSCPKNGVLVAKHRFFSMVVKPSLREFSLSPY